MIFQLIFAKFVIGVSSQIKIFENMAFGHVTEMLTAKFSFYFQLTLNSSIYLLINLINSLTYSSRPMPLILMYFIEGKSLLISQTFDQNF